MIDESSEMDPLRGKPEIVQASSLAAAHTLNAPYCMHVACVGYHEVNEGVDCH